MAYHVASGKPILPNPTTATVEGARSLNTFSRILLLHMCSHQGRHLLRRILWRMRLPGKLEDYLQNRRAIFAGDGGQRIVLNRREYILVLQAQRFGLLHLETSHGPLAHSGEGAHGVPVGRSIVILIKIEVLRQII